MENFNCKQLGFGLSLVCYLPLARSSRAALDYLSYTRSRGAVTRVQTLIAAA